MKKRNATNVAASVHQRLLNLAKETKRPYNELLQYYTMGRYLFQLGNSPFCGSFYVEVALMLYMVKFILDCSVKILIDDGESTEDCGTLEWGVRFFLHKKSPNITSEDFNRLGALQHE
jgi:hypothetical protein